MPQVDAQSLKIIGHRGAAGLAPENTMQSVTEALAAGVDEIEIDIRITADNVVVLCHDSNLRRLTGQNAVINDHKFKDLQAIKPNLCSLEPVIRLVNQRVPLILDIKPGVAATPIIQLLTMFLQSGWQPQSFLVASRSVAILTAFHTALPTIPLIINEPFLSIRARSRARRFGTKRLAMNHLFLWFGFVGAISKHYDLYAYTLNNPARAQRWLRYGLKGVYTDSPARYITRDLDRTRTQVAEAVVNEV